MALGKRGKIWRWWLAATMAMALAGAWLAWPQPRLEVWDQDRGRTLFSLPAAAGQEAVIRFFHSYDRAPFSEHYRLRPEGGFVLTRLAFRSCLNGQGFVGGVYRALADGSAEVDRLEQPFDEVGFRLGSPDLANHALIFDGRRLRLLDYAQAGDLLHLRFLNRPRWQILWQAPWTRTAAARDLDIGGKDGDEHGQQAR